MHEHVGGRQKSIEWDWIELEADIHESWHNSMMEYMKEADLGCFLAQYEEESVEELQISCVEEEMTIVEHQVAFASAQSFSAAPKVKSISEGGQRTEKQVSVDDHQQKVVESDGQLQVVRFPVAHKFRSSLEDYVKV